VYRWVEHTSEVELSIEAESEEAVFAEAAVALGELIDGPGDGAVTRPVSVRAADLPALLAAWLEELVFIAETEGVVPEGVDALHVGPGEARGTVRGHRGPPQTLVKAVTYHRLEMAPTAGGWRARVVLDV
jgi:SHS2 domain-containing protein